jgi:splicing factor 45
MGLFGDLPSARESATKGDPGGPGSTPSSTTPGKRRDDDPGASTPSGTTTTTTPGSHGHPGGTWSGAGSTLRAPPRKPAALLTPQLLKAQAQLLKAKLARQNEGKASAPQGLSFLFGSGGVVVAGAGAAVAEATLWGGTLSADVAEEYVPSRPNSYEDVVRERERKKTVEAAAVARETHRLALERQRHEIEREREADLAGAPADRTVLHVSGEQAFLRRGGLAPGGVSTSGRGGGGGGVDSLRGTDGAGNMSLAQKMMMKMGWKEGQGLGKSDQGMTTPLMAKKDSSRSGVIVNAPEIAPRQPPPQQPLPRVHSFAGAPAFVVADTPSSFAAAQVTTQKSTVAPAPGPNPAATPPTGPPTRVLLLRNMIAPGEVDADLEEEVAEECEKFGKVVRVMIFEVTDAGFPAKEAVRIFVEFTGTAAAMRCAADMHGRYFGGRTVAASYYGEARFASNDLGPQLGERAVGS